MGHDLDDDELKATRKRLENNVVSVGDYVRTKKHGIFKVTDIRKTEYGYYRGLTDNEKFSTFTIGKRLGGSNEIKKDIEKHSPNLIDLIEVGDYIKSSDGIKGKVDFIALPLKIFVNGEEVLYDEIKSIVTHEQFAQIEYKVEE